MPSEEINGLEDQLASWLAAYDDALASGTHYDGQGETSQKADPSASDRLEKDRLCLEMLERLWPRSREKPSNPTVASAETLADTFPVEIGRFQVVEHLGTGGQGTVWLAFDPR